MGATSAMTLADWQLPPGVNRGLWDYLHNPAVASSASPSTPVSE